MRLGGRLSAAIEILGDIETRKRPVADALKDWGLSHRFAGSGDRAAIGNIVYDVLRQRLSLAWRMDGESERDLVYAAVLSAEGSTPGELAAGLEGDHFAPPPLDAAAIEAWTARRLEDAPPHVRADVPEWCVPLLESVFGSDWIAEGAALAARPPLDLRANTLKASRERVLKELARQGALAAPLISQALRIEPVAGFARHPNIQVQGAFQKGWVEVQDLGSQIAAALAGARPGEQVLDYCAGAGGKTLALAASMENRGQIHAYDAEPPRLAPIYERLKRAGVRNAQVHADAETLAPLENRMDLVLVDAPCTGSGTWRRRPDAKWRLTHEQLARRVDEQREVLRAAARYVRPGGRLAYVTCSLFFEENGAQVARFLTEHSDFRPLDAGGLWSATVAPDASVRPLFRDDGVVLSPARTGTDGFFCAYLERSG